MIVADDDGIAVIERGGNAPFFFLFRAVDVGGGPEIAATCVPLPEASIERSAPSPAARTDALAEALAGSSWPPGVSGWSEGRREEFARCLVALARKPDLPLGEQTRERYPAFVAHLFRTLGDSADPEQAARLLGPFFSRVASPEGYAKAFEGRPDALARLVSVLGTSRYLGEGLIGHPALVDRALFAFSVPRPSAPASVPGRVWRARHTPSRRRIIAG